MWRTEGASETSIAAFCCVVLEVLVGFWEFLLSRFLRIAEAATAPDECRPRPLMDASTSWRHRCGTNRLGQDACFIALTAAGSTINTRWLLGCCAMGSG
jgi:hypothetical protein